MENISLNKPLLFASLIMGVTCLVHVFAGGPELYDPLRLSDLSVSARATFSVVWHFTTMQLFLLTIGLLYLALFANKALFAFVLTTVIGFAALFIGYGLHDLGSVWPLPQWIAFALCAGCMMWGMRR